MDKERSKSCVSHFLCISREVCVCVCAFVYMCLHIHVYMCKCVFDYLQLENNVNSSFGKQLKMVLSDLSLFPDPMAECWALRKVVWAAYHLVALHSETKRQNPRESLVSGRVKHGSQIQSDSHKELPLEFWGTSSQFVPPSNHLWRVSYVVWQDT